MLLNGIIKRFISTTSVRNGKRNFKKFPVYNKRGSRIFKQRQHESPDPAIPIDNRGLRHVGYVDPNTKKFVVVPEMIPELIVPDLTNFKLKPYVSYRAQEVIQSEFSAKDLFDSVYAPKIHKDFVDDKLNEDGTPQNSSELERTTPDEARIKARQTGSDLFYGS